MAEVVQIGKKWKFQCPRCWFWREYDTMSGALTKAAEHCLARHRLRLEIERKPGTVHPSPQRGADAD